MTDVEAALVALGPALAFLLAGVPLAALLDRLGYFDAVAAEIARRRPELPVLTLWMLAAATTVVRNLDTTIVLLTPLYLQLARRAGVDPLPVVLIPLVLAGLASSVLPVSNLTTLIVALAADLVPGPSPVRCRGARSPCRRHCWWRSWRRSSPWSYRPARSAAGST